MGSSPSQVKPNPIKLAFSAFTSKLPILRKRLRAKTVCIRIRIMCRGGATCLPMACWFRELAVLICNEACWSSTKWTSSSFHQSATYIFTPWNSRKNCSFGVKELLTHSNKGKQLVSKNYFFNLYQSHIILFFDVIIPF